jgi:homoserine/homoserine lactone efflux protein
MSLQTFLLYLVTWTLVALIPGPAVMCSMAQSVRHGFRSSLAGIAGIQTGNFLFFVCVAFGLGALLTEATTAFTVLRVVGAIYLLYLGVRIILSSFRRTGSKVVPVGDVKPPPHGSLFLQGLLIQLTNPKALLFVSALLPQFIDPHRAAIPQLAVLVVTTIAVDLISLSSYAFLARCGIQSFRGSRFSAWLERVFGAALIFFGVRLLVSRK